MPGPSEFAGGDTVHGGIPASTRPDGEPGHIELTAQEKLKLAMRTGQDDTQDAEVVPLGGVYETPDAG